MGSPFVGLITVLVSRPLLCVCFLLGHGACCRPGPSSAPLPCQVPFLLRSHSSLLPPPLLLFVCSCICFYSSLCSPSAPSCASSSALAGSALPRRALPESAHLKQGPRASPKESPHTMSPLVHCDEEGTARSSAAQPASVSVWAKRSAKFSRQISMRQV